MISTQFWFCFFHHLVLVSRTSLLFRITDFFTLLLRKVFVQQEKLKSFPRSNAQQIASGDLNSTRFSNLAQLLPLEKITTITNEGGA